MSRDKCQHGSLRRKCEICERDEEIRRMRICILYLRSIALDNGYTDDQLYYELDEAIKTGRTTK